MSACVGNCLSIFLASLGWPTEKYLICVPPVPRTSAAKHRSDGYAANHQSDNAAVTVRFISRFPCGLRRRFQSLGGRSETAMIGAGAVFRAGRHATEIRELVADIIGLQEVEWQHDHHDHQDGGTGPGPLSPIRKRRCGTSLAPFSGSGGYLWQPPKAGRPPDVTV